MKKPIILAIMDGFGIGTDDGTNAIYKANTPTLDSLMREFPTTLINASGLEVGLPEGQMGNSEVGHMNIGAGRAVYQNLTKIDKAIEDKTFFDNEELIAAYEHVSKTGGSMHVMGLLSDGGVHSHIKHFKAAYMFDGRYPNVTVWIHPFMDGRDTKPANGLEYLEQVCSCGVGTISGRYFSMDRDKNFDRLQPVLDSLLGKGNTFENASEYIKTEHVAGKTDEFITPARNAKFTGLKEGDAIIMINFRPDRAMQLGASLTNPDYENKMDMPTNVKIVTMTKYSNDVKATIAYPPEKINNTLGEFISNQGLSQLRIAETEKYAHVTFFLDGGEDKDIKGADRILVPSPKVATYDMQPEMSLPEVTTKLLAAINEDKYDLIILNYANCDMVGHTGNFDAAKKAIEAVDNGIKQIFDLAVTEKGGVMIITSDHGNADKMKDREGNVVTAHSTNMVPVIVTDKSVELLEDGEGCLSGIAPSLIKLLNKEVPVEMTGKSIIK